MSDVIAINNCLSSMAPSDEELLRHALDEEPLPIGAMGHLEHCSICQQRLTSYKQANEFLLVQLYRHQCPSATSLNYYCADLLSDDERMHTASHILECPLCASEVADIRSVLNNFDPFPEPEESPVRRFVQHLIATLIPLQPQLVMRGESALPAQTVWPRQYRAGTVSVSLHLSRGSLGDAVLLGLFSATGPEENIESLEEVPVVLYRVQDSEQGDPEHRDETLFMSTHVDDLGSVAFKGVPVGEYSMVVRMPDCEVVIEGLTIDRG